MTAAEVTLRHELKSLLKKAVKGESSRNHPSAAKAALIAPLGGTDKSVPFQNRDEL